MALGYLARHDWKLKDPVHGPLNYEHLLFNVAVLLISPLVDDFIEEFGLLARGSACKFKGNDSAITAGLNAWITEYTPANLSQFSQEEGFILKVAGALLMTRLDDEKRKRFIGTPV